MTDFDLESRRASAMSANSALIAQYLSEPESDDEPSSSVPAAAPKASPIENRFKVVKLNKFGMKQERFLELDTQHRGIRFMKPSGQVKSEYPFAAITNIARLSEVDPKCSDPLKLVIDFKAARSYHIIFASIQDLEQFLDIALGLLAQNPLFADRSRAVSHRSAAGDSHASSATSPPSFTSPQSSASATSLGSVPALPVSVGSGALAGNVTIPLGNRSPSPHTSGRRIAGSIDITNSQEAGAIPFQKRNSTGAIGVEDDDDEDGTGVAPEVPSGEDYLDYQVMKKNKFGIKQERIVVLNAARRTLLLLHGNRKFVKEFDLDLVTHIDVPSTEQQNHACIVFDSQSGQRPFSLFFVDAFDRIHFCERLVTMNSAVVLKEEKDEAVDGGPLRFPVVKINKAGVKLKRVLYLDPKKQVIRSLDIKTAAKDTSIAGDKLVKIEKSLTDKHELTLHFSDREPWHFIFPDTAARERFAFRCSAISRAPNFTEPPSVIAAAEINALPPQFPLCTPHVVTAPPPSRELSTVSEEKEMSPPPPPAPLRTDSNDLAFPARSGDLETPPPPPPRALSLNAGALAAAAAIDYDSDEDSPPLAPPAGSPPNDFGGLGRPSFAADDPLSSISVQSLPPPPPPPGAEDMPATIPRTISDPPPPPPATALNGPSGLNTHMSHRHNNFEEIEKTEKETLLKADPPFPENDDQGMPSAPPVSMLIGTWNVGGAGFTYESLRQFIPPKHLDLYVIGLQECTKKDQWLAELKSHILQDWNANVAVEDQSHVLFCMEKLWDITLMIFVRRQMVNRLSNLEIQTVATGAADVLGNKGAVAASFDLDGSSLCFVCSHLAARAERLLQRRDNYTKIVRGLKLGRKDYDILNQFDHVFWFGDLNYRIELEYAETLHLIKERNWAKLQSADQLSAEIKSNQAFSGFQEGSLVFDPTYRWERTENLYNNKRFQSPSWTDRVLWKSLPERQKFMRLLSYRGCPDVLGSDHRPVHALFLLLPQPLHVLGLQMPVPQRNLVLSDLKFESFVQHEQPPAFQLKFAATSLESEIISDPAPFAANRRGWIWGRPVGLAPFVSEVAALAQLHATVTLVSTSMPTEAVGFGVLPLRACVESEEPLKPFHLPITKDGAVIGVLHGYGFSKVKKPTGTPKITKAPRATSNVHS